MIAVAIAAGRAPFDLAEAESELVAGTTTELGGVAFTLILLVDYLELLIGIGASAIFVGVYVGNIFFIFVIIILSFIGRLILCRFNPTRLAYFVYSILL